jgi:hypothetical protein
MICGGRRERCHFPFQRNRLRFSEQSADIHAQSSELESSVLNLSHSHERKRKAGQTYITQISLATFVDVIVADMTSKEVDELGFPREQQVTLVLDRSIAMQLGEK